MEPFSLRCFVTVARLGSFSRAAAALYRTQPAVSLQVRKLERELGRELFDRTRRSAALTEAGHSLYAGACDLLERLDRLPELAALGGEPAGTLTIASNLSLISHFLPPAVGELHRRHPRVHMRLVNRTTHGIGRAVEEGDADIGVGFLIEDGPGIEAVEIFRSPFVLVSPPPKRGRAGLRPEGVVGGTRGLARILAGPIVHFEEGVELRRQLENELLSGRSLQPVIELSSIEAILAFVADGFGATILPEFSVSVAWRKRLVVRGAGRAITPLAVRSCTRRGHALSRAAAACLELVQASAPKARP